MGTALLKMPFVQHQDGLSFIDALFTATSAVCVTGLTVVNTSGFNIAGQIVLMFLMQLGAIGIMTLTTSLVLLISGNIDLKQQVSFSKLQDSISMKSSSGILQFILKITFITEFIGAILLTIGFLNQGLELNEAMYQGVFHSISAFCNAGFSTFDSSLIGMNSIIKYTIMALIIVGGVGYVVVFEVYRKFKYKVRLGFHSKIVIFTSLILIIIPTLFLYFTESGLSLFTDSLFQSVTARTAGFNSVDTASLHTVTLMIVIILMFIGGSTGSTAGGIKTTTFFVSMIPVFKILRGDKTVVVNQKHIPHSVILKAYAIITLYMLLIFVATVSLLLAYPNFTLLNTLFEVVSATGTVGLSTGVSAEIATFGKIVLILCMYLGRIGPASLAMIKTNKDYQPKIYYPQEKINLG
ncbi:MAG: potassium transporter TrkG [Flavobacteriaceae bacterium]|nr:potassium transporter TrkG [Flavobacteriaceae bacterium]